QNVMTGIDQLVNGTDNMKGWGTARTAESTLLNVRSFDPNTNAFKYEVNEGFGQTRRGIRSQPFRLMLSGRIAVGGQAFQNNRGFGPPIALGAGGGEGRGGGPGGGGFGGPGGFGGGDGGGRGGDNSMGELMGMFRGMNPSTMTNDSLFNVALSNPVRGVIALKDSLKLTDIQLNTI